jgi:hypothetical protein
VVAAEVGLIFISYRTPLQTSPREQNLKIRRLGSSTQPNIFGGLLGYAEAARYANAKPQPNLQKSKTYAVLARDPKKKQNQNLSPIPKLTRFSPSLVTP